MDTLLFKSINRTSSLLSSSVIADWTSSTLAPDSGNDKRDGRPVDYQHLKQRVVSDELFFEAFGRGVERIVHQLLSQYQRLDLD